MENRERKKQEKYKRALLNKELQKRVKDLMKEKALSNHKMYRAIGIACQTFDLFMSFDDELNEPLRMDVLYKIENYLDDVQNSK